MSEQESQTETTISLEEAKAADEKAAKEIMEIFEAYIMSEAKNTSFLVRAHPKAEAAFKIFGEKMVKMLSAFICEDTMPEINLFDKERIENSNAGFWANRVVKKKVEREAQVS